MASRNFSVGAAISYGWRETKKKLKFFLVLILIVGIAYIAPGIISGIFGQDENSLFSFVITIVGWVVQVAVFLGFIGILLRVHDNKNAKYEHLLDHLNLILPYIFASILYVLMVVIGLILFVIPGIYLGIKYGYYPFFMVDRKMGPIEALKASGKITEGVKWKIFWFRIVQTAINIVGILCFGVGLFITYPITWMADAYVYRKLTSK